MHTSISMIVFEELMLLGCKILDTFQVVNLIFSRSRLHTSLLNTLYVVQVSMCNRLAVEKNELFEVFFKVFIYRTTASFQNILI